jgi:hypothetical protein
MGKRKTHATEDQFGEIRSQDRDTFQPPASRGGMRGGGGAGSSRRSNADLSFQRHVPKFLQPYAHMLGKKPQQSEDEPVVANAQEVERHAAEAGEEDDAAGEAVSPHSAAICWYAPQHCNAHAAAAAAAATHTAMQLHVLACLCPCGQTHGVTESRCMVAVDLTWLILTPRSTPHQACVSQPQHLHTSSTHGGHCHAC